MATTTTGQTDRMATMIFNMFPMRVTTPDGDVFRTCRVVSDGRQVTAWQWDGHDYVIVAEGDAEGLEGSGPTWQLGVPTDDGFVLVTELARDDGCGCGHPLKNYTPQTTTGARRAYVDPA